MHPRFCFLIVPLIAAVLAPQARACSQCMCGTPFPADALGGVVPMQVRYGLEDRYLSKSNALDEGPGTESEREHRVAGFVLWRASNRLALLGRLPYNVNELTESPEGEIATTQTTRGLGDAEATALVGLWHTNSSNPTVLGLVLGITAPTGSNEQKNPASERLDAHLQPGTGAWSGTTGLNVGVHISSGIVDGSVLGRVNGTSSHGYHYGNVLLFNAGYTSPPMHGVWLTAHLNGRTAEHDTFEDGTTGEHTGGTVVYVAPGARWETRLGFDLEGLVQIPVIESLYGIQDEHTTARIALSMSH